MMQKLTNSSWLGPVISGLLAFFAICHFNIPASLVCYVPVFISIENTSAKLTFKKGLVFGIALAVLSFSWMIPGAERFTGYHMIYGLGVFLISAILFSLFWGALFLCIHVLKATGAHLRSVISNTLITAAVFCIGEALLNWISQGLPWFAAHSGNALAENIYTIQPASLFGIHMLTFTIVAVNYLVADIVLKKKWVRLYIPATILALHLFAGFLLLNNFEKKSFPGKKFDVAILAENIPPDIKWDDQTGNMLVGKLLDLNRLAVTLKPAFTLWSESAIPWTYDKNDDLVKEIFKITDTAKITHLMGINTAYRENEVLNSAYCILPNGNVTGRYDKQYLLSFIEKPLNGWLIPFFSSNGYLVQNNLQHSVPLTTAFGKVGFLICNEATIPQAAANQVRNGAGFLVNMSNDGWFNDTYIVKSHFIYARLRAVESRKDLALNCNNGYSGLIKASGIIAEQEKSEEPFVRMVSMQSNNVATLASACPDLFVYCCLALVPVLALLNLRNRSKANILFVKAATKKEQK